MSLNISEFLSEPEAANSTSVSTYAPIQDATSPLSVNQFLVSTSPVQNTIEGFEDSWRGPKPTTALSSIAGGSDYLNLVNSNRMGRMGFFESMFGGIDEQDIPFAGDFFSAGEMLNIGSIVKRLNNGETVSDEDLVKFNTYLQTTERAENASALGKVGAITRGSVRFGVELAAIMALSAVGVGEALGAGKITGEAGEAVAKKAFKKGLAGVIQRYSVGTAAQVAKTTAMKEAYVGTVNAMVGKVLKSGFSKGATDVFARTSFVMAEKGVKGMLLNLARGTGHTQRSIAEKKLENIFRGDDEEAHNAVIMGILDAQIETSSELMGAEIFAGIGNILTKIGGKKAADIMSKIVSGSAFRLTASKYGVKSLDQFADIVGSMGAGGIAEEFAEERFGGFMRGLLGVQGENPNALMNAIDQAIPAGSDMGIEILAFGLPGVIGKTAAYASRSTHLGGVGFKAASDNAKAVKELRRVSDEVDKGEKIDVVLETSALVPLVKEQAALVRDNPEAHNTLKTMFGLGGDLQTMLLQQEKGDLVNLYNVVLDITKDEGAADKALGRAIASQQGIRTHGIDTEEDVRLFNELEKKKIVTREGDAWVLTKDADYTQDIILKLATSGKLPLLLDAADMENSGEISTAREFIDSTSKPWAELDSKERSKVIDSLSNRYGKRARGDLYEDAVTVEDVKTKYETFRTLINGIDAQRNMPVAEGDVIVLAKDTEGTADKKEYVVEAINGKEVKLEGEEGPVALSHVQKADSGTHYVTSGTLIKGTAAEIEEGLNGHVIPKDTKPYVNNGSYEKNVYLIKRNAFNDNSGNIYTSLDSSAFGMAEDVLESSMRRKNLARGMDEFSIGTEGEEFFNQVAGSILKAVNEIDAIPKKKRTPVQKKYVGQLKDLVSNLSGAEDIGTDLTPQGKRIRFELLNSFYLLRRMEIDPSIGASPEFYDLIMSLDIPDAAWELLDAKVRSDLGNSLYSNFWRLGGIRKPSEDVGALEEMDEGDSTGEEEIEPPEVAGSVVEPVEDTTMEPVAEPAAEIVKETVPETSEKPATKEVKPVAEGEKATAAETFDKVEEILGLTPRMNNEIKKAFKKNTGWSNSAEIIETDNVPDYLENIQIDSEAFNNIEQGMGEEYEAGALRSAVEKHLEWMGRTQDVQNLLDAAMKGMQLYRNGIGRQMLYRKAHESDPYLANDFTGKQKRMWGQLTKNEEKAFDAVQKTLDAMGDVDPIYKKYMDSALHTFKSMIRIPNTFVVKTDEKSGKILNVYPNNNVNRTNMMYRSVSKKMYPTTMLRSLGLDSIINSGREWAVLDGVIGQRAIDGNETTWETRNEIAEFLWNKKPHEDSYWMPVGRYGDKNQMVLVKMPRLKGDKLNKRFADYVKDYIEFDMPEDANVDGLMPHPTVIDSKNTSLFEQNHILNMYAIGSKIFGRPDTFKDIDDMNKRLSQVFTPGIAVAADFEFFVFDDTTFDDEKLFDGMSLMPKELMQKIADTMGPLAANVDAAHILKAFMVYNDKAGNLISIKPLFSDVSQLTGLKNMENLQKIMVQKNAVAIPLSSMKVNGLNFDSLPVIKGLLDSEGNVIDITSKDVSLPEFETESFDGELYVNQDMNYSDEAKDSFALVQLDSLRRYLEPEFVKAFDAMENLQVQESLRGEGVSSLANALPNTRQRIDEAPLDPSEDNPEDNGTLEMDVRDGNASENIFSGPEGENATAKTVSHVSRRSRVKFPRLLKAVILGTNANKRIKFERKGAKFNPSAYDTNMKNGMYSSAHTDKIHEIKTLLHIQGAVDEYPWMYQTDWSTGKPDPTRVIYDRIQQDPETGLYFIPGQMLFGARIPASSEAFGMPGYLNAPVGTENASVEWSNEFDIKVQGSDGDGDLTHFVTLHRNEDGTFPIDDSRRGLANRMLLMWYEAFTQHTDAMEKAMNIGPNIKRFDKYMPTDRPATRSWYTSAGQRDSHYTMVGGKKSVGIIASNSHILRLLNTLGIGFDGGEIDFPYAGIKMIRKPQDMERLSKNQGELLEEDNVWVNDLLNLLLDDPKDPRAEALGINEFTAPFVAMFSLGGAGHRNNREAYLAKIFKWLQTSETLKSYVNHRRNGEMPDVALSMATGPAAEKKDMRRMLEVQKQIRPIADLWRLRTKAPNNVVDYQRVTDRIDELEKTSLFSTTGLRKLYKGINEEGTFRYPFGVTENRRVVFDDIFSWHPAHTSRGRQIIDEADDMRRETMGAPYISPKRYALMLRQQVGVSALQDADDARSMDQVRSSISAQLAQHKYNKFADKITTESTKKGYVITLKGKPADRMDYPEHEAYMAIQEGFDDLPDSLKHDLVLYSYMKYGSNPSMWNGNYIRYIGPAYRKIMLGKLGAAHKRWKENTLSEDEWFNTREFFDRSGMFNRSATGVQETDMVFDDMNTEEFMSGVRENAAKQPIPQTTIQEASEAIEEFQELDPVDEMRVSMGFEPRDKPESPSQSIELITEGIGDSGQLMFNGDRKIHRVYLDEVRNMQAAISSGEKTARALERLLEESNAIPPYKMNADVAGERVGNASSISNDHIAVINPRDPTTLKANGKFAPVETFPATKQGNKDAESLVKDLKREFPKKSKEELRQGREANMAVTFALEKQDKIIVGTKKDRLYSPEIAERLESDPDRSGPNDKATWTQLSAMAAMKREMENEEFNHNITQKEAANQLDKWIKSDPGGKQYTIFTPQFYEKTVAKIAREWNANHKDKKWNEIMLRARELYLKALKNENEYVAPFTDFDNDWIKLMKDYSYHGYTPSSMARKEARKLREQTASAKKRKYATFLEAAAIAGLTPDANSKFTGLYERRNADVWKAAFNRSLLSQAAVLQEESGAPTLLISPNPNTIISGNAQSDAAISTEIYAKSLDQFITFLNLEKVRVGEKPTYRVDPKVDVREQLSKLIKDFDPVQHGYVRRGIDEKKERIYNSIESMYVKSDSKMEKILTKITQRPFEGKFAKGVAVFNALSKEMQLTLSGFHYFSLFESWVSMFGITPKNPGLGFGFKNQLNDLRDLKKHYDTNPSDYVRWIAAGLRADMRNPDVETGINSDLMNRAISTLEDNGAHVLAAGAKGLRFLRKKNSQLLWGYVHPMLKLHSAERVFQDVKDHPEDYSYEGMPDERIREDIAQLVNDALGGQEFERAMWTTPRVMQMMNALVFAHDWTFSAANIAGSLFGTNFIAADGASALQKKWARRKYWPAMLTIVMFAIPNALQSLIYFGSGGDPDKGDHPFVWQNEEGKNKGPFGIPGIGHIDITPLARRLPGYRGLPTGTRRVYMRFAKQATEVFEGWVEKPIRTALAKSSTSVKTVLEQFAGEETGGWDTDFKEITLGESFFRGKSKGYAGGRLAYVGKKFVPMSVISLLEGRPSTFFAPASRGMSKVSAQTEMARMLTAYADDTVWSAIKDNEDYRMNLVNLFPEILEAVERNGYDPEAVFTTARRHVLTGLYNDFFYAMEKNNTADLERTAQAILRVHGTVKAMEQSMKKKYSELPEKDLTPELLEAARSAFQ